MEPGKPTQNAYIESFNGKFRDEWLIEHWFETLAHAAWRHDYNEVRPHSNCNRMPPAKFAALHYRTKMEQHNRAVKKFKLATQGLCYF